MTNGELFAFCFKKMWSKKWSRILFLCVTTITILTIAYSIIFAPKKDETVYHASNIDEFTACVAHNISNISKNVIIEYDGSFDEEIILKANNKLYNEYFSVTNGFENNKSWSTKYTYDSDNIYKFNIKLAYFGTTVDVKLKRKIFEKKVNKICSKIYTEEMTEYEKVKATNDYLIKSAKYKKFFTRNDGYGALVSKSTKCLGYASGVKALMDACGMDCKIVFGSSNDFWGKFIGHAWNLVKVGDGYYHIDSTWNDVDDGHYNYFMKTDAEMSKTHVWENADYPACDSTEFAYSTIQNNTSNEDNNSTIEDNNTNGDDNLTVEDINTNDDDNSSIDKGCTSNGNEYSSNMCTLILNKFLYL